LAASKKQKGESYFHYRFTEHDQNKIIERTKSQPKTIILVSKQGDQVGII